MKVLDGLLHGAVRLADHARADVILGIDTSPAEAVPGVRKPCSPRPTCPASC